MENHIKDFKTNLCDFVEDINLILDSYIKDKYTNDKLDTYYKILDVMDTVEDMEKIITLFINNTYLYWDEILDKKENYFIENCEKIFGNLDKNTVDNIRKIFIDNIITHEDKNVIWDYLKVLIIISSKYIHSKRGPKIVSDKKSYSKEFMKDVKLKHIEKKCDFSLWK